jgi:hypothetical protein
MFEEAKDNGIAGRFVKDGHLFPKIPCLDRVGWLSVANLTEDQEQSLKKSSPLCGSDWDVMDSWLHDP